MHGSPKIVAAEVPDHGRMYYLVDARLDFITEVKEFLDWKAATQRAPATIKAYCSRLHWYYRFLAQQNLNVREVRAADLTEFVIWLCNPYRDDDKMTVIHQPSPISASSVNLILQAVGALYRFLVRRGTLETSPVRYVDVPRGKWLRERDLLAHTRRGPQAQLTQRMELKLKEPKRLPATISEQDFQTFLQSIHMGKEPQTDPCGFRDRLLCLMLKEGGFRLGEVLGMHMEDLDFGEGGVHVRFRPHNENAARAKAGYGRDRFVHLPPAVMGLLDLYITEVWVEADPHTDHLWIILKKDARNRDGISTCGAALSIAAVESMFEHYSRKSGIALHPHMLRHTHATALVRSYLCEGENPANEEAGEERSIDWKFIQERLGHASVVTTMQVYIHLTDKDRQQAYSAYLKRREQMYARQRRSADNPIAPPEP
jgi:integrase/recombinase XerD